MSSNFVADGGDTELAQIGFVFVTISGIVALIIALVVWSRWDTSRIKSSNKSGVFSNSTEYTFSSGQMIGFLVMVLLVYFTFYFFFHWP